MAINKFRLDIWQHLVMMSCWQWLLCCMACPCFIRTCLLSPKFPYMHFWCMEVLPCVCACARIRMQTCPLPACGLTRGALLSCGSVYSNQRCDHLFGSDIVGRVDCVGFKSLGRYAIFSVGAAASVLNLEVQLCIGHFISQAAFDVSAFFPRSFQRFLTRL